MAERNAWTGRPAASQWWASSAAAPAALDSAKRRRGGQDGREALVDCASLGRQQGRLDDLAEQGVTKSQRARRRVGDQDAGRDRRPDRLADLRLGALRDGGHQPFVDRATGDRDEAEQSLRLVREGRDLAAERLRQGPRQLGAPPRRSAATSSSTKNGLPSERAWIRSTTSSDGPPRGLEQDGDLAGDVLAAQRRELDPARLEIALQAGQPGTDRVAARDLLATDRQDQQQPLAIEIAGEERDEVACRAVGPVKILEDEHGRAIGGEAGEQLQDEAEQPCLVEPAAGVRSLGGARRCQRRAPSVVPARAPTPGRSRAISARAGPRIASTVAAGRSRRKPRSASVSGAYGRPSSPRSRQPPIEDSIVLGAGEVEQLADEARLPDARLAGDDHDLGRALGHAGQRGTERLELRRSPDQFRTRDGARHSLGSLRAARAL